MNTSSFSIDQKPIMGYLDIRTPINASLTAFFQRSFAFQTVKFRLPAIVTQTIDNIVKKKDDIIKIYGEDAIEDVQNVIADISKLKLEIQSNKPLRKLNGNTPDIMKYNKFLELQTLKVSIPTYFNSNWILVECYMYRRITEAFESTKLLKDLDPFQSFKEDAFFRTLHTMSVMGSHLQGTLNNTDSNKEEEFIKFLKLNLWGNKCDLSLTMGRIRHDTDKLMDIEKLNANILCDNTLNIWDALTEETESQIVDIVLDNCGYELFTDMCLADFILKNKYAQQIRFYVKTLPWFISDVTTKDFNWTLHQLKSAKNAILKKLAERWSNYLKIKTWTLEEHDFWILPFTYKDMAKWDLDLYRKLSAAKLIIFKGDVNYRKLFGEKNWPPTTPVADALQGFHPSKLCSIRTLKAHIICGLPDGLADEIEEKDKDWLIDGNYGVIQFCERIIKK